MNDGIQPYSSLYVYEFVSSFHLEAQCKKKVFLFCLFFTNARNVGCTLGMRFPDFKPSIAGGNLIN